MKKRKVVKEIKVGALSYKTKWDNKIMWENDKMAHCSYRRRRIALNPHMSDSDIVVTVMHETLHAFGEYHEIKELTDHQTDDQGKHTDWIDRMAKGLVTLIRENPKLVAWIQNGR